MTTEPPKTLLDKIFHVSVFIKGIDGVIEVIGGLILLFVPISKIRGLGEITVYELQQDHHAFVAQAVIGLNSHLTPKIALISALYLIVHGTIKLLLATALFRNVYQLYPLAISLLLITIFYESYRVGLDRSYIIAFLTLFDIFIVAMAYQEWRLHPVRRSRLRLRPDEIILRSNDNQKENEKIS